MCGVYVHVYVVCVYVCPVFFCLGVHLEGAAGKKKGAGGNDEEGIVGHGGSVSTGPGPQEC